MPEQESAAAHQNNSTATKEARLELVPLTFEDDNDLDALEGQLEDDELEAWNSLSLSETYLAEQRLETDRKFRAAMGTLCGMVILGVLIGNWLGMKI
jgi:hypothetical protein